MACSAAMEASLSNLYNESSHKLSLCPSLSNGAPWIHHQWMSQHPLAVQVSLPLSLDWVDHRQTTLWGTRKTLGEEPLLQKGILASWQRHFFRTLVNCKPQVFRIRISFHVAPNWIRMLRFGRFHLARQMAGTGATLPTKSTHNHSTPGAFDPSSKQIVRQFISSCLNFDPKKMLGCGRRKRWENN